MPSERFSNETGDDPLSEGLRLYHRARDTGDWTPFVAWLGDHPELASEIAQHIKTDKIGREWFPTRMTPIHTGMMIDEFEIREEIGRGGMGVVYRAFDTKLKREVALKMIRPGIPLSAVELAKFREEAETVAAFDHENIVPILSFGGTDDSPYLVMPLLKESLAARLKHFGEARRLPEKEAAKLVRDIALGVHHAHQRGLIHRDLKPGNILLDEKGRPHVADFGLARRADVAATISGAIVGTVAYMSPEQARGDKYLTTGADVHALGVILFELLTGGLPYGGTDYPSILRRIADETESVPLVSRFRPDVSADLEAICSKCLEKDAANRYASAQALADALERFLNDEPQRDASRRGWTTDLSRVIGRRIKMPSMTSWPALLWGLISLTTSQCMIQVAVLNGSTPWLARTGWAVYFSGWFIVIWLFGLARIRELNRIERAGVAQHIGMILASLALFGVNLDADGGYGLAVYPSLFAVIGLGTFFQGAYYWGRYYLVGSGMILLAVLMPLIPMKLWPAFFLVQQVSMMLWAALRMRAFDQEDKAALAQS
jgi:serine/threonine-protein kinase